jgi:hypothetical protein
VDDLKTDTERAEYLQNILISTATGGGGEDKDYKLLRQQFNDNPVAAALLPSFVRTNRDLTQFWGFIKYKFGTYQERRDFIYAEFQPLFGHLEGTRKRPADPAVSEALKSFDEKGVQEVWAKALSRRDVDPEGAITASRTLLESVCKHILDAQKVDYDKGRLELPDLYKATAKELNISPSQHVEEIFRQILGGVASVVTGLGALRNKLGDAHGQGKAPVKPAPRHAQLAVNLAGATSLFLIETWQARNELSSEKFQPQAVSYRSDTVSKETVSHVPFKKKYK